jgi:2'-5' RNA ligase
VERTSLIPRDESDTRREPARRLFFALWPDEALRSEFAHATHEAARVCGGRPVPAHNLHATLLFLGSVAESRVAEVRAMGARAAAEPVAVPSPPLLTYDRIEFWKKAHVLVATTSAASGAGHSLASALVGVLQRETISAGFAPDLKPFRAHVTVARKVSRVSQALHMHAVQWPVTGLTLVESVTLAEGPRYDAIDSWTLGAVSPRA